MHSITLTQRCFVIAQLSIIFSWILFALISPHVLEMATRKQLNQIHCELHLEEPIHEKAALTWAEYFEKTVPINYFEKLEWILNLLIPVMIIYQVKGAKKLSLILPVITLLYIINVYTHPIAKEQSSYEQLFPPESVLFKSREVKSLWEQQEQLKISWDTYLLDRFNEKDPLKAKALFAKEEYDALKKDYYSSKEIRQTLGPILWFFFLWQTLFALFMLFDSPYARKVSSLN